jgi:hypothetical protein
VPGTIHGSFEPIVRRTRKGVLDSFVQLLSIPNVARDKANIVKDADLIRRPWVLGEYHPGYSKFPMLRRLSLPKSIRLLQEER